MTIEKKALHQAKEHAESILKRPLTEIEEMMVLFGVHYGQQVTSEEVVGIIDNHTQRSNDAIRHIQNRTRETFRDMSRRR